MSSSFKALFKSLYAAIGLVLAAAGSAQAADVGVSVSISQPGVYGRIDIGRFPQPQLIVQQPVIVQRVVRQPLPIYMHVPPGQRMNWKRYCRDYGACGVPVYFVQDRWYDQHVRPRGPDRGYRADRDDRDNRDDKHGRHDQGRHGGRD